MNVWHYPNKTHFLKKMDLSHNLPATCSRRIVVTMDPANKVDVQQKAHTIPSRIPDEAAITQMLRAIRAEVTAAQMAERLHQLRCEENNRANIAASQIAERQHHQYCEQINSTFLGYDWRGLPTYGY